MPVPALVTDIVVSLDDTFLYASCWLQGHVRQYDIRDPAHPRLTAAFYLGGIMRRFGAARIAAQGGTEQVDASSVRADVASVAIRGRDVPLAGGPQMLQLSLDGRRLYVTSSLLSSWDAQFYPKLAAAGSFCLRLACGVEPGVGGLALDESFAVDLSTEPGGPARAHEMRFPGGDSTSDVWM
jgi:selenium-binding protein 1